MVVVGLENLRIFWRREERAAPRSGARLTIRVKKFGQKIPPRMAWFFFMERA